MQEYFLRKKIELVMGIALLVAAYFLTRYGANSIMSTSNNATKKDGKITIVVDAGHGGEDPGKEGINGSLEKDINLSIALKLQKLLEAKDINVVMTRTTGKGLNDENSNNKKIDDLKKRVEVMDNSNADLVVSVHHNSYPKEEINGPQVFYHEQSQKGKEIAEFMQKHLIEELKPEWERESKPNESYYILKKTKIPIIIVECGFLSNKREADLLATDEYQDKVANAICSGLIKYFEL